MSKMKFLLAASTAGACLSIAGSAQGGEHGLVWTNLGELRAKPASEHVLSGKAAAIYALEGVRAELAPLAFQETVDSTGSALQMTNTGELRPFVFEGHVLTPGAADGGATTILYAPSEADDPGYRAAISAAAGGATVDYFDARASTPSVATLSQYDAVYTWANFAYQNNTLFGDNLAAYNDVGGTVVLGVFCTYTTGNFLSGMIMTAAYCPVDSPFGNNHFTNSNYVGDGTTCIYNGVTSLSCTFRDFLVTQGSGVVDGHYADNEICHAFRGTSGSGQGDVIYSNGAGAFQLGCSGQWGTAVGNACVCSVGGGGVAKILYAPSEADDPSYRAQISAAAGGATVDYFDCVSSTPRFAILAGYDAVHTWANFAYHQPVKFGDRLASFVDAGGNVTLGAFCTYTSGNFLSGNIMTAGYCPVVSPFGNNHFSTDTDNGPFASCLGTGVSSITGFYRDFLTTQGTGVVAGNFDGDNEISLAYRPNPGGGAGGVNYVNGSGGVPLFGSGAYTDYPIAVANGSTCTPASLTMPVCTPRIGDLAVNPLGTSCVTQPIVGQVLDVQVDTTPVTSATFIAIGLGGPVSGLGVLGYELLVLPPFAISAGLGLHSLPVPMSAPTGLTLAMQGAFVDPTGVALTNALDVTLGL